MIRRLFFHARGNLLRGLLLVLPLIVTAWVVLLIFGVVSRQATPRLQEIVVSLGVAPPEGALGRFLFSFSSVVLTAILIYLVGLIGGNLSGRRSLQWVESWILKVPLVGSVYGPMRQLLDALGSEKKTHFSRVVMVEYPRPETWTMGFVTTEKRHSLPNGKGDHLSVFLPTTPNPTSGWLVFVAADVVIDLDLTVEEAIKLIVSGGIVGPADLGELIR